MSPEAFNRHNSLYSVPRASGDEPADNPDLDSTSECSPRERG